MQDKIKSYLSEKDEVLKDIIETIPYPTLESTHQVFHDLMSCIVEQQIHYRSTKRIFEKAMNRAELTILTIENYPIFEEKGLRDVKMSAKKHETILNVVTFFEENDINWSALSDDEVKKTLKQIKGVGPWTIVMILMFTLQRPNIFTPDDYHIKQLMTSLYPIDTSSKVNRQLKEVAAHWSPYQSIAVRYLLDYKAFQKKSK